MQITAVEYGHQSIGPYNFVPIGEKHLTHKQLMPAEYRAEVTFKFGSKDEFNEFAKWIESEMKNA